MKYFITHKISAYMLFAGLFIFGIIGLDRLAVSLMPQTNYPGISIIIEYPGVAPQKIETTITKPIEKIVKTVSGIEKINSISEEGKSRINISFKLDTNIKIAALKVREKIGLIWSYFPREVQDPVVVRFDPSDKPVVIATLNKKGTDPIKLREIAERNIKPMLQRIDGISEINIAGGLQREIHINIDQAKFQARALSFNTLSSVVQNSNVALPGGTIRANNKDHIIYTSSRYQDISQIGNTIIMQGSQGTPVLLKDVADVVHSYRDREDIARLNGEERITIYVHKAGDANTLTVSRQAVKLLEENKYADAKIIYNQGTFISSAVSNVVSSGIYGVLIVILILTLFLRRLNTVLTISLSIPLSLIIVFSLMYFFGFDLNVMSLSGLALGAGMIVDNGIVIADTIYENTSLTIEHIVTSVSRVRNAIISSTLTTIIVFLPIVFGNKATQLTYGDLAFTVSGALVISLVIAIILVPTILFATHNTKGILEKANNKLYEKAAVLFDRFDAVEKNIVTQYEKLIDYALNNRKKIISYTALLSIIAIVCYTFIKTEMVDPSGSREFYTYLEFPTGTSLEHTNEAVSLAEEKLKSMQCAEKISTKVEKWRGTLAITFKENISSLEDQKKIKDTIKQDVGSILKKYNGFVFISEADEVAARELSLTFLGNDNDVLKEQAKKAARLVGSIQGIEDCVLRFREGRPEYRLTVDKAKASLSGLSSADITGFFRSSVFGPVVTKFVDKEREVDVRMRFAKTQRESIGSILGYSISGKDNKLIPVSELVTMDDSQRGPTKIWRQNGRRSVSITAKIGSLSYEEAANKIARKLEQLKLPEEYTYQFDDNLKKMQENKRSMALAIVLAIVLIYMLLASLFESLRLPVIIMTTVPLAVIGVIITLFLTSTTISISVYIGLIVLAGIVVNNGIILVNAVRHGYKTYSHSNEVLKNFIKSVALKRFRPVMITTITTILGLVPMLLKSGDGSNLWRPLSLTVISGLVFSTALTLIIVPLFCYTLFNTTREEK